MDASLRRTKESGKGGWRLPQPRRIEEQVKVVACPGFETAGQRGGGGSLRASNSLFCDLSSLFGRKSSLFRSVGNLAK